MPKACKINKEYIEMREGFIPEAEETANKTHGPVRGDKPAEEWADAWNTEFHKQMERLVRKCIADCAMGWIVGTEACRVYLHAGSWRAARRWAKRYGAPLRYWVDGRPVFYKAEIDAWLREQKEAAADMGK